MKRLVHIFYWSEKSGSPTRYWFTFLFSFHDVWICRQFAEVRNCQRHIFISLHLVSALDGLNWNYLNKRNTKIQIMFWSRAVNNFIQAFNQLLCWRCGAELCNYVYIKSIGDIKGKYIEVGYIFFGDQGFPFRNMHTQKEIDESHVLTEIEWRHFSWELFGVHWKCLPTFEILKRLTT